MRIDVHNHAIPRETIDLFARDDRFGVRIEGGSWQGGVHVDFAVLPSFVEPEAKLAELESKGIDGAVVSAAPPLFYYHVDADAGETVARETNRGLAAFAARGDGRLRWLATVPLQAPELAAAVLEEAADKGAAGVEIGTSVHGRRLDDPSFEPFWEAAERLRLPVLLHPAYNTENSGLQDYYLENVIGNMLETTIAVERLICSGMLDRHPGLQLVLAHAGGYFPYQAGRLRHARRVRPELAEAPEDPWAYLDRLWFDTITHDTATLAYLVERVGADRVVPGTDLPFDMAPPAPMDEVAAAVDATTVERIAERNPARLFKLD